MELRLCLLNFACSVFLMFWLWGAPWWRLGGKEDGESGENGKRWEGNGVSDYVVEVRDEREE